MIPGVHFSVYMWQVTSDKWHVTCDKWQVTCDKWQLTCEIFFFFISCHIFSDSLRLQEYTQVLYKKHMTSDKWHVTSDMWHVTCDNIIFISISCHIFLNFLRARGILKCNFKGPYPSENFKTHMAFMAILWPYCGHLWPNGARWQKCAICMLMFYLVWSF